MGLFLKDLVVVLLSMASNLGGVSGFDVLLETRPVVLVQLPPFKKQLVLLFRPPALIKLLLAWLRRTLHSGLL